MTHNSSTNTQQDMANWPDEQLVKAAQHQLPHVTLAFEALLQRHEQKIFHVCLRYLGDEGLAQDISQEVFLKVFQQLKNFRGEAQFSTWLYRIALNACHTQHGKKTLGTDDIDNWLDDIQLSIESDCSDEADCIQHCLNQQTEQERAVLSMRFNADLSIQEIADILSIKLSAAKMRLYRSIETLKKHYETFCL